MPDWIGTRLSADINLGAPVGTFAFNETGTFPYYCRFHGDNGGVGMAGTIIVQ